MRPGGRLNRRRHGAELTVAIKTPGSRETSLVSKGPGDLTLRALHATVSTRRAPGSKVERCQHRRARAFHVFEAGEGGRRPVIHAPSQPVAGSAALSRSRAEAIDDGRARANAFSAFWYALGGRPLGDRCVNAPLSRRVQDEAWRSRAVYQGDYLRSLRANPHRHRGEGGAGARTWWPRWCTVPRARAGAAEARWTAILE